MNFYEKATEKGRVMMQEGNVADKRIFARIPIRFPVRFLASGSNRESTGQSVDISADGVGMTSAEKLSPQTSLEMWLELPENRGSFYTRGEVMWASSLPDTTQRRVGIHLEKAQLMELAPVLWR